VDVNGENTILNKNIAIDEFLSSQPDQDPIPDSFSDDQKRAALFIGSLFLGSGNPSDYNKLKEMMYKKGLGANKYEDGLLQSEGDYKDNYMRFVNELDYTLISEEAITPTNFAQFLLGNFVLGIGPENYVFPENGSVSNEIRNSEIVKNAFREWSALNKEAIADMGELSSY